MSQNYRHPRESWNSDQATGYARGGRYRSGTEGDRYQSGGEQRYAPQRGRPDERGFEGDRSYSGGGYSEETGYRRGAGRIEPQSLNYGGVSRDHWQRNPRWQDSNPAYDTGRGYDGQRDDWNNRWNQESRSGQPAYGDAYEQAEEALGGSLNRDENYDFHGYYGTGNYSSVDEFAPISKMRGGRFYGGEHDREQAMRPQRGLSGDYENYGRSGYGSQSSFGRSYGGNGPDFGAQSGGIDYGPSSHRGRGPKGYERSEERLREVICERLTDDPCIDASEVAVEVKGKTIKLTGSVNDRRTKYLIEELVERTANVQDIDNQLRVQRPQRSDWDKENTAGSGTTTPWSASGSSSISGASTASTPSSGRKN